MGLTSLQVCMDSSDWLQGTIHEETGMDMDSSSSPSGEMQLACSARPPLMMDQRRLMMRPPHDQALKCPRCESTHTKFCYYNNYSLSQPRYFCKTCRRYWTKGGTLRNIPVGGGCRKNKKVSSKKSSSSSPSNDHHHHHHQPLNNTQNHHLGLSSSTSHNPTDLQLSFPQEVQFPHLSNFLENPSFMESKYNSMVENPMPFNFMGSTNFVAGFGDHMSHGLGPNFHPTCSPFGMPLDGNTTTTDTTNGGHFMDACQRLVLPNYEDQNEVVDVKPNAKLLSLDHPWQDQGCTSDAGRDSFGYINGLGVGSWTGLINGYGTSTTNPLV